MGPAAGEPAPAGVVAEDEAGFWPEQTRALRPSTEARARSFSERCGVSSEWSDSRTPHPLLMVGS